MGADARRQRLLEAATGRIDNSIRCGRGGIRSSISCGRRIAIAPSTSTASAIRRVTGKTAS
jgi:hypothetical protein